MCSHVGRRQKPRPCTTSKHLAQLLSSPLRVIQPTSNDESAVRRVDANPTDLKQPTPHARVPRRAGHPVPAVLKSWRCLRIETALGTRTCLMDTSNSLHRSLLASCCRFNASAAGLKSQSDPRPWRTAFVQSSATKWADRACRGATIFEGRASQR